MAQPTALVASAAVALACGGAIAPAQETQDRSNHAATPGLPEAATPRGGEGAPVAEAVRGVPQDHVCVRAGNSFYLLGGYSGDVMAESVEKYDPAADAWETLPSLPTARLRLGAAAIGGEIFAFGGEKIVTTANVDSGLLAVVEVLRVSRP